MTRAQLEKWDVHIHAFVSLAEAEVNQIAGPLSGLTVGIKDIIDVAGLPTRCGSAILENTSPATQDAPVVASLRAAGAQIVGKTTTTEFAFTDPTPCRNPHNLTRSPGGSSSGSGAAVAAGVVDIALGTQTAGSLCRPAAYCGVVGFKPSAGVLSLSGVAPLAPSFDTVGIIARDLDLATAVFEVMAPDAAPQNMPANFNAICGLWNSTASVQEDWAVALSDAKASLDVPNRELPADIDAIVEAHRTVMGAEAAAEYGHLLDGAQADLLQPKFRGGLETGLLVTAPQLAEARTFLADAKEHFWQTLDDIDLVLTLPVPDGAPLIDGTTGFQDWLTPWTVFGGPLLCLPWGIDRQSRPCSVMLAAHPGQDNWLLKVAKQLEIAAPPIAVPALPI